VRNLPEKLRHKIRYYFKNLRLPFEELRSHLELLKDLPVSLQEDIAVVINRELIEGDKFLKAGGPEFIAKISRFLKPQINIINEYVFYKDSAAKSLFFINEGVCEVLASDERTLIRFMSKGTYFGEIGCLVTGKRTCSVVARTTTLLYSIKKAQLLAVLEDYPEQMSKMRNVANRRNKVVNPEDISTQRTEEEQISSQIKQLETAYTVFGKMESEKETNLPLL
jgi:CRP-like cAMP-binding protein